MKRSHSFAYTIPAMLLAGALLCGTFALAVGPDADLTRGTWIAPELAAPITFIADESQ